MSNPQNIQLGDRVQCIVTGAKGVVMGESMWINKCQRFAVQQEKVDKDGKAPEAQWFDVEQLKLVKKGVIPVKEEVPVARRPNGPQHTPQRRADAKR